MTSVRTNILTFFDKCSRCDLFFISVVSTVCGTGIPLPVTALAMKPSKSTVWLENRERNVFIKIDFLISCGFARTSLTMDQLF